MDKKRSWILAKTSKEMNTKSGFWDEITFIK